MWRDALWCMICCGFLALGPARADFLKHGDFEGYQDDKLLGWENEGDAAWRPRMTGGWFPEIIRFNSGEYETIRLYLRLQAGTGTVWFDDVSAPGLELAHPGFETADEGRFAGWGQDNVGETIFFGQEGSYEGARCAAITELEDEERMHRLWQDVGCEPNTDYTISFAMKTSGLVGDAYGEVYGLTAEGELGEIVGQSSHVTSDRANDLGDIVAEVELEAGKRAVLAQSLQPPADANLAISIMLLLDEAEAARVGLRVVAAPKEGEERPLGEVLADPGVPGWQHIGVWLQTADEPRVRVELFAEGESGAVVADNVRLDYARPEPRPLMFRPGPASKNWIVPEKLTVHLDWSTPREDTKVEHLDGGPIVRSALMLLSEALGGVEIAPPTHTVHHGLPAHGGPEDAGEGGEHEEEHAADISIMCRTPFARLFPKVDAFGMSVDATGVRLDAVSPRGILMGLVALADMVAEDADGRLYAPTALLQDKPSIEFRGTYIAASPRLTDELKARLHSFVRLRLTHVLFESVDFFHLDDEETRQDAVECFQYCRDLGLEPIPELQSFGWAHFQLAIDANIAEGQFVEDEEIELTGADPVALAHPNVLRTETTDIIVRSADGETTYEPDKDYRVIDGVTKYIFQPEAAPFHLARLPDGRIPEGATVRVSYDYAPLVGRSNVPYCPSEPRVYGILEPAIELVITHLKPRFLHIGHDEPALMNSDSRCRARGLTNAQLMAADIKRLYDVAKELDPRIQLMMWADALNPLHNGLLFADDPTADAAELIPFDIIQCVWFYGSAEPAAKGLPSLEYFAGLGLPTTGSPWDDIECNLQWADVCYTARQRGYRCLGALYTSWDNRWDGLETFAHSTWRVPQRLGLPK